MLTSNHNIMGDSIKLKHMVLAFRISRTPFFHLLPPHQPCFQTHLSASPLIYHPLTSTMAYHDDDYDSDSYQSADELLSTPDEERNQPASPPTLHSTFQNFKLSPSHTRHRRRRHCWPAQKRRRVILVALLIIGVVTLSLYL